MTIGVERRDQVIGSIQFVLLQRHDARCGCRIVWRRAAAMELEHGVGFVDRDDNSDGLHQRPVWYPLAFRNGDERAGRELVRGQAVAARSGLPVIWGHHVMGTPRVCKFFVKISELNLSTPEARYVKNKNRIYAAADWVRPAASARKFTHRVHFDRATDIAPSGTKIAEEHIANREQTVYSARTACSLLVFRESRS